MKDLDKLTQMMADADSKMKAGGLPSSEELNAALLLSTNVMDAITSVLVKRREGHYDGLSEDFERGMNTVLRETATAALLAAIGVKYSEQDNN